MFAPIHQESQSKAISRRIRKLRSENVRALGLVLNLENWKAVYDANDVDNKVECFNKIIDNVLDAYAPVKCVRIHPNDKEWMTPYIKTLSVVNVGYFPQRTFMFLKPVRLSGDVT